MVASAMAREVGKGEGDWRWDRVGERGGGRTYSLIDLLFGTSLRPVGSRL